MAGRVLVAGARRATRARRHDRRLRGGRRTAAVGGAPTLQPAIGPVGRTGRADPGRRPTPARSIATSILARRRYNGAVPSVALRRSARRLAASALAIAVALAPARGRAAGFALFEQSARGLGS